MLGPFRPCQGRRAPAGQVAPDRSVPRFPQGAKRKSTDLSGHDFVRHGAGAYGRANVYTNTIEGYFSIFRRGMNQFAILFGERLDA